MLPPNPTIRPGDSDSGGLDAHTANYLNRALENVHRVDREAHRFGSGDEPSFPANLPFMAQITGRSGSTYSWFRLVTLDGGLVSQDGWGLSGSFTSLPAYAIDGSTTVTTGTRVLMWYADTYTEMRFVVPGKVFSVVEADGFGPTSDSQLKIPDTGLLDNGDGTVTLRATDATHVGLVNLGPSTQRLGDGTKSVDAADGFQIDNGVSEVCKFEAASTGLGAGSGTMLSNYVSSGGTRSTALVLGTQTNRLVLFSEGAIYGANNPQYCVNGPLGLTIGQSGTVSGLGFAGGIFGGGSISITSAEVSDFQEAAQDNVGGAFTSTSTITATYDDGLNAMSWDVVCQMSITADASGLKLVNDSASPGNSKLYGTDSGGTKGWYDQPAALSDGDKGDITVSGSGATWTIDNSAVTFAKMQAISTDVLLGNDGADSTVQEITCTSFARDILDDADAASARSTLGLGTIAVEDAGATGSFTAQSGETVTVTNGVVVSIV